MNVDFPAPFSPIKAWTSPSRRSKETPLNACTPAKDFVMDLASSSDVIFYQRALLLFNYACLTGTPPRDVH
jgi:hypothetical protein